jgi:hypothetical protein
MKMKHLLPLEILLPSGNHLLQVNLIKYHDHVPFFYRVQITYDRKIPHAFHLAFMKTFL